MSQSQKASKDLALYLRLFIEELYFFPSRLGTYLHKAWSSALYDQNNTFQVIMNIIEKYQKCLQYLSKFFFNKFKSFLITTKGFFYLFV